MTTNENRRHRVSGWCRHLTERRCAEWFHCFFRFFYVGHFLSLLNLLHYCFCFMFWFFGQEACRILASQPGINPAPPALEDKGLTTGPRGKSPPASDFKWQYFNLHYPKGKGFPHSSAGKESTCNAGDASLIPGSGRSSEEGIGYTLQYSWASLVVQLVKNLPAAWETWVWSLGWFPGPPGKIPWRRERLPSILAWRIPWTIQFTGSQRVGHN